MLNQALAAVHRVYIGIGFTKSVDDVSPEKSSCTEDRNRMSYPPSAPETNTQAFDLPPSDDLEHRMLDMAQSIQFQEY